MNNFTRCKIFLGQVSQIFRNCHSLTFFLLFFVVGAVKSHAGPGFYEVVSCLHGHFFGVKNDEKTNPVDAMKTVIYVNVCQF